MSRNRTTASPVQALLPPAFRRQGNSGRLNRDRVCVGGTNTASGCAGECANAGLIGVGRGRGAMVRPDRPRRASGRAGKRHGARARASTERDTRACMSAGASSGECPSSNAHTHTYTARHGTPRWRGHAQQRLTSHSYKNLIIFLTPGQNPENGVICLKPFSILSAGGHRRTAGHISANTAPMSVGLGQCRR